jgi:hypothetical protein
VRCGAKENQGLITINAAEKLSDLLNQGFLGIVCLGAPMPTRLNRGEKKGRDRAPLQDR